MEFPVIAGLILSLAILYWPGQATPQWVKDWINRLWLLLGVTFLAGIALSFYTMTSKALPNGGIVYSTSRSHYIQYALIAIYIPLMLLTLLGAGHTVRSIARQWAPSRALEAWRTASAGIQLRKLWGSLAVALCALSVAVTFGTPVIITTDNPVPDLWGLAIYTVSAIVFFTALAAAWSAAKPSRERQ